MMKLESIAILGRARGISSMEGRALTSRILFKGLEALTTHFKEEVTKDSSNNSINMSIGSIQSRTQISRKDTATPGAQMGESSTTSTIVRALRSSSATLLRTFISSTSPNTTKPRTSSNSRTRSTGTRMSTSKSSTRNTFAKSSNLNSSGRTFPKRTTTVATPSATLEETLNKM